MEQTFTPTKYVDPMVDVAFKILFGTEKNKHLTKELLDNVFNVRILSLSFVNVEHHGLSLEDRNAVFDLQCESEELGQFLVEVQVKQQEHFPERALFYSCYPILEQAPQGVWDYSIKPVFFLGILNFKIPNSSSDTFVHRYSLLDECTHMPMTDKVKYVFMEAGAFNKPYESCKTFEDKFLYFFKNLPTFAEKPDTHSDQFFEDLLQAAEYLKMDLNMRTEYDVRLKTLRDNYSADQFLIKKAKAEVAKTMLADGVPIETVAKYSELSIETLSSLAL